MDEQEIKRFKREEQQKKPRQQAKMVAPQGLYIPFDVLLIILVVGILFAVSVALVAGYVLGINGY